MQPADAALRARYRAATNPLKETNSRRNSPLTTIISTHSFRGGTGKSNITANLAVLIARAGHRVGVIDTDIQSPGIHVLFRVDDKKLTHSLNDYLWGRCPIEAAAVDVSERCIGALNEENGRPRLFLIPSSLRPGEIA